MGNEEMTMKRVALALLLTLVASPVAAQRLGHADITPTRHPEIWKVLDSRFADTLYAMARFQVMDRTPSKGDDELAAVVSPDFPQVIQYIRPPARVGLDITYDELLAHEIGHVAFGDTPEHKRAPEFVADVVATTLGRRATFRAHEWKYGSDTTNIRLRIEQLVRERLAIGITPTPGLPKSR